MTTPGAPTSARTAALLTSAGVWWHRLSPLVGLALFAVAILVLGGELRKMPPRELAATMRAMPTTALALAAVLTFLNYLILTGYDQLAFVYIRRPIGRWQIAMASFVGYAIANNVGFALLSGTSARYRFYSRWGLSGEDISRVVLFYSSTYWLGLNVVGGWALAGGEIQGIDAYVPASLARLTGWLFLISALAYPLFVLIRKTPICVGGVRIELPSMALVGSQFLLSMLDWVLASAVLYVLVPAPRPDFLYFLGAFLAAQLVALISHVPGGLGVFESLMVLLLGLPAVKVLPALALFRVIYYLVPLAGALLVLIVDEISQRRHQVVQWGNAFGTLTASVAPKLLAIFTMLAGGVLLASAASPSEGRRLAWLASVLPLPVIEVSHFGASLAGDAPAAGGVGPGATAGRCVPPGRGCACHRHRAVAAQGTRLRDVGRACGAAGGVDAESRGVHPPCGDARRAVLAVVGRQHDDDRGRRDRAGPVRIQGSRLPTRAVVVGGPLWRHVALPARQRRRHPRAHRAGRCTR